MRTSILSERHGSALPAQERSISGYQRRTDDTALVQQIAQRAIPARKYSRVDFEPFMQMVLQQVRDTENPIEALNRLAIDDLYLAYACSVGSEPALKAFAKECEPEFQTVVARLKVSAADADDLRQKLWDKLFLNGAGSPMRILEYRGLGRLRHWVRVLAARMVLDEFRKSKRGTMLNTLAHGENFLLSAQAADPELDNLLRQYRPIFRKAFERAAQDLEPHERNLLKCHFIRGMSTDQLGVSFGVHKATAARHLARSRERLLAGIREQLRALSGANSEELDSVIRLFEGNVSLSLSRLLG